MGNDVVRFFVLRDEVQIALNASVRQCQQSCAGEVGGWSPPVPRLDVKGVDCMEQNIEKRRSRFPKFYELYQLSEQSHPDNFFTNAFQRQFAHEPQLAEMSYWPLEKALERLDKEAWLQLVGKAMPWIIQKHPARQWSQLFNHFYEAFGYEWLAENGYTNIKFVERSDKRAQRTPELIGKSKTSTAILEVKTINRSDDEIRRLGVFPAPVINLGQSLSEGFKNKFLEDTRNAKAQLEKFDEPTDKKIVLIVIRPDCEFWLRGEIYGEIEKLAEAQRTSDFEVVLYHLVR
jgi:hypothetical protein